LHEPEPNRPHESYASGLSSLPDELPISEARDCLADVVAQATYSGQITYITKRGSQSARSSRSSRRGR
jgi:hypothetical protein